MRWIKLKHRKPDNKIDGSKIFVHREINEGDGFSTSIMPTRMIRYCDDNSTYWMAMPDNPIEV